MKTLEDHKKNIEQLKNKMHYVIECDYCKTKLFVSEDDFEKHLYNPVMKEHEVAKMGDDGKWHWGKEKVAVSSDHTKDIYECKCCYCGHIINIPRKVRFEERIGWDGTNRFSFELSEEQTKQAKEFMKKHTECVRRIADPIGTSFAYEIVPSSIGIFVTLKCLGCGETINLTEYDKF